MGVRRPSDLPKTKRTSVVACDKSSGHFAVRPQRAMDLWGMMFRALYCNSKRQQANLARHTPDDLLLQLAATAHGYSAQPPSLHLSETGRAFQPSGACSDGRSNLCAGSALFWPRVEAWLNPSADRQ